MRFLSVILYCGSGYPGRSEGQAGFLLHFGKTTDIIEEKAEFPGEKSMEHELIKLSQNSVVYVFETAIRYRANHFHQEQEMFLVLSGDITVVSSGKLYNLHKGDVAIFGKNRFHMLKADAGNLLLVAQFNLDALNLRFPQMEAFQRLSTVVPCDAQSALWQVLRRNFLLIAAHQAKNSPYVHLISLNALLTMILAFVRHMDLPEAGGPKAVPDRTSPRQERLLRWINDNYQHNITLQQLAEQEGLNAYYLSHYIKERLGFTFTQYVTELRTAHAAHLLESTDLPILDILMDSGFSDYRYLRKAFRQRFHCTPKEYRSASKAQQLPRSDGENVLIFSDMPQFTEALTAYCPDFPRAFLLD